MLWVIKSLSLPKVLVHHVVVVVDVGVDVDEGLVEDEEEKELHVGETLLVGEMLLVDEMDEMLLVDVVSEVKIVHPIVETNQTLVGLVDVGVDVDVEEHPVVHIVNHPILKTDQEFLFPFDALAIVVALGKEKNVVDLHLLVLVALFKKPFQQQSKRGY